MALIKCPECGKEVSNKSQQCINCGYPMQKNHEKVRITTSKNPCPKCGANWHIIEGNNDVCKACGYIFGKEQIIQRKPVTKQNATPHCPTCGSTNISRISGTERAASVFGLGIMSKKINKTFKCNNPKCKYTW